MRRRKSRRRIAVARTPIPKPEGPNSRWSLDFVHDQVAWPLMPEWREGALAETEEIEELDVEF